MRFFLKLFRWPPAWRGSRLRSAEETAKPQGSPRGNRATAPVRIADQAAASQQETEQLLLEQATQENQAPAALQLGPALSGRSPYLFGLLAGLGLLTAYGLVHVFLQLAEVLTFLLVAIFLALGLEPVVAKLISWHIRRPWAVLLVILGLAAIFAGIGWLVVPKVVGQVSTLIDRTPRYISDLQHNKLLEDANQRWHVVDKLENQAKSGINQKTATSLFGGVLGAGKAVLDGVVAAFTVLILTLYFMVALPGAKTAAYKLVPRSRRTRVVYLGEEMSRRVGGFVLGQVTVAVINGVLAYAMLLVLHIPFAVVLAVVLALLALVPLVGTLIGAVLVILVALSVGWVTALLALGYYVAYHIIESYVLAPRIMRRAVEVPAVVTVVAILAGGTLLGVVGALIAIPVAASLLLLYEEVVVPRQQSR